MLSIKAETRPTASPEPDLIYMQNYFRHAKVNGAVMGRNKRLQNVNPSRDHVLPNQASQLYGPVRGQTGEETPL